jgi:hypothetical protein
MYIPIEKTLSARMTFEPIDYDIYMMAVNQVNNADQFYQGKYEFWKKYGAVIVFAVTIVFLIILVVLTYEYVNDIVAKILGQATTTGNLLQDIANKVAGTGKPPV